MALPATPLPSFPAIPVLDVETLLARLPAEARARVAWAKKPIEDGLARLRTEPLTDDLIARVADETVKPLASLGSAFWLIVRENQDEWRSKLMDDFNREEHQLAAFVADDDSHDTLRCIVGLLRSLLGQSFSVPPEVIPQLAQLDQTALAALESDEDFKPYLRAGVALMAAFETGKAGGDPRRARDLLDVAFLELNKFRAALRKHGVWLTPFPYETSDERHRGLLESADRLRNALSDEDWRVLEQARMHDLR